MSRRRKDLSYESQQYDKLTQENIEELFLPFVKKHLGIELIESEPLKVKLHRTHVREVDWLFKVKDKEGNIFILHIEFQSRNDGKMVYRIGEYHGMIQRIYQLEIKHFVVFLSDEPMKMETKLPENHIYNGFEGFYFYKTLFICR